MTTISDAYYLDEDNNPVPCSIEEWGRKHKDRKHWTFGIPRHYISTVFLGIDHNYGGGLPILWETMVFTNNYEDSRYQERCSTYKEARWMHLRGILWAVKNLFHSMIA